MRTNYFLTLLLLLLTSNQIFSQTKTIFITKTPKIVPQGKKWKLEIGKPTKIQVNEGVLNSGTFCNAMFLSNPQIIWNINKGSFYEAESFGIMFKNLEKVPYTNDITFTITPRTFVDKNFSLSELQTKKVEEVGISKLEFIGGESVFIGNCLESIELIESNMTQTEILSQTKKNEQQEAKESLISSNFNIPIKSDSYVVAGTKPKYQDKNLDYIILSSSAVLWQKPGKGMSADESEWTLTLTQKNFQMKSMNHEKKFKVVGVSFDEVFQMQKFSLADENGNQTFNLLISYNVDSKNYSVIVGSLDNKEEYQFQEVTAKKKEFKK